MSPARSARASPAHEMRGGMLVKAAPDAEKTMRVDFEASLSTMKIILKQERDGVVHDFVLFTLDLATLFVGWDSEHQDVFVLGAKHQDKVFHPTALDTCTACPSNTQSGLGSTVLTSCVCNLGFTGPDSGTCAACAAGKYKTVPGPDTCTDCDAGTYLTTTGATALAPCTACPSNTQSGLGSTSLSSCVCNLGFTGPDGGPCAAFAAGKYKTVPGTVACTDCAAGTYSTTTGATALDTCTACPSNTQSGLGSTVLTSCVCNLGFTGPNGETCAACAAGKYKYWRGPETCYDCDAGTYSTTTGAIALATCIACPSNTQSDLGSTSCVCNLGFTGPDGGTCTACAAGKYKTVTGPDTCTDCAAGKYSATMAATACWACPEVSTASPDRTSCQCNTV